MFRDVFKAHNYATNFFYPSSNSFDNQDTFYFSHAIDKVYSYQDFPPNSAKGGWGFSDHALFKLAFKNTVFSKIPSFSVVLTLTNHSPYGVPNDCQKIL